MAQTVKPTKEDKKANRPVEAGEFLHDPVKQLTDIPKGMVNEALEQIGLKPRRAPLSGTINVASGSHQTNEYAVDQAKARPNVENVNRQLQYQKNQEKVVFDQKRQAVEKQVEQLMAELTSEIGKLHAQTAELSSDIKNISVASAPAKVGQYHLNFFAWMLKEIRDIRKKVSTSRLWLNATYQKKQKRGYWQMAKKHGNNFMMAGERTPAGGAG